MTRKTGNATMTLRGKIVIAALIAFAVLVAGLGFCDVWQNHILRDCGPDCDGPASGASL